MNNEIELLKGRYLVVKIGGEIAEQHNISTCLVKDLVDLREQGVFVVLCHGGGPQFSRALKASSLESKFINGHRVTDNHTRDLIIKVLLGEINPFLVNSIQSNGGTAVGLSGFDGKLYQVRQRDAQLGWVGDIVSVNDELVRQLCKAGYIPVIACLGINNLGEIHNINGDSAAASLASALTAEEVIFFTNVEGLYRSFEDRSSLISRITLSELQELYNTKEMAEGIIPKIEGVIHSIKGGVAKAMIVDGRKEHALLKCLSPQNYYGTLVVKE